MSFSEIREKIHELGNVWEEYKHTNDQRILDMEVKGLVDPLTVEKLAQLNDVLDDRKEALDNLLLDVQRPGVSEHSMSSADPYDKHFDSYLRKGIMPDMHKALPVPYASTSASHGAAMISPTMSKKMLLGLTVTNPFRQLSSIKRISTSSLEILKSSGSLTFPGTGWALERTLPGGLIASDPTYVGVINIPTYELYVQPVTTPGFADDINIDFEDWMTKEAIRVFAQQEEKAFLYGNGNDRPIGIFAMPISNDSSLPDTIQAIKTGVRGDLGTDSIFQLYYSLADPYVGNASFLMHRTVLARIRLQKYNGEHIWQPGYASDGRETIIGVPVYCSTKMPVLGDDEYAVILGDFKHGTIIVDRMYMDVMRDPFTYKPLIAYYIRRRVGFSVVDTNAIKLLQLSA